MVFSTRKAHSTRKALSTRGTLAALTLLGLLVVTPTRSDASVLITIVESGSDVTATGSGTIDLTSLTLFSTTTASGGINASLGAVRLGVSPGLFLGVNRYSGLTGSTSMGTIAGFQNATSGTGDRFGVSGGTPTPELSVPAGYVSGASLSGTLLWSGKSFASLGLTPGTYTWNWGSGGTADSLTVQISATSSAAPEPGTLALLVLGIAGGVVARCRK